MRRLVLPLLVLALSSAAMVAVGSPAQAAAPTTALGVLNSLTVRAESYSSTYVRSAFHHWIDADHDSCDTREEVLIAESTVTARRGSYCKILSGRWYSYY